MQIAAPGPHEAEGDGGGVGAAATAGDTVAGQWTLAGSRRADGRGGLQRGVAVAGDSAPAGSAGLAPKPVPGCPPKLTARQRPLADLRKRGNVDRHSLSP